LVQVHLAGHVFVFNFKKKNSPCLRCFMPEIPEWRHDGLPK